MTINRICGCTGFALLLCAVVANAAGNAPAGLPESIVDLQTKDGVAVVKGAWRYSDATIMKIEHRSVGADLKASGAPNTTNDFKPAAHGKDFDDSAWQTIDPASLQDRRGNGRLSFAWYRINVTVPKEVGGIDPRGMVAVFEICNRRLRGGVGGRCVAVRAGAERRRGCGGLERAESRGADARCATGRLVSDRGVCDEWASVDAPGYVHLDAFGDAEFLYAGEMESRKESRCENRAARSAIDSVVPKDAVLEKVADGLTFTEGPVWHPDGYLLCRADPNMNVIYRVTSDGEVSVYRPSSGFTGANIHEYRQPGSNGLGFDAQGRLTICEHGNRRVTRLEKNGADCACGSVSGSDR